MWNVKIYSNGDINSEVDYYAAEFNRGTDEDVEYYITLRKELVQDCIQRLQFELEYLNNK